AVVAVEVPPARGLHRLAAVDETAGDRAAVGVRVDDHRLHFRADARVAVARGVDGVALVAAPAVVREPGELRLGPKVDLLPLVLADVADPEVARRRVER